MRLTSLLILNLCCLLSGCNNTTITGYLPEELNADDKWAYILLMDANQYQIADSALIRDGRFKFKFDIADPQTGEIAIKGAECPVNLFFITPGDKMVVHFTPGEQYPPVSGAPNNEVFYHYSRKKREIAQKHIRPLTDSLLLLAPGDSIRFRQIMDTRQCYLIKRYETIAEMILAFDHPSFAIATLNILEYPDYQAPQSLVDSIVKVITTRFAHSPEIEQLTNKDFKIPPPTAADSAAKRSWDRITGREKPSENKSEAVPETSIVPYVENDVVADFELPDINGENISLKSLKTEYILIDFWATWCQPCCREIPLLIDIQKKYKNVLSIFTISIDENVEFWKKYVLLNDMKPLANVWLTNEVSRRFEIMNLFQVKFIPRNFLLDKDRRIIAINLHGDELEAKLKELTSK